MLRMLFIVIALSAIACSKGLDTIESAEAFAKSRGVVLAEKTEDTKQAVAPRCFDYRSGEVYVGILQFNTAEAAKAYKEVMDQSPLSSEQKIVHGPIMFMVAEGSDSERQKVVAALQP
ncbi:hypothetical protein D7X74_29855 [Corallococcus sp. CA047B]|uniref:hypothetical protein n=1 Tax=Corallococcus sp. CA047B TaxID=2316729 RepID=UPI000EA3D4FA|nr:hypothetical protein [Corallococcus sp. CA047B]RKH09333.1 hypothetical protein D7X74_29855 [Corallococcus sp. CA047B]